MYYKLLRQSEIHYGYQFHDGLNVDPKPWTTKICSAGGFYFCNEEHIWQWAYLYNNSEDTLGWIRSVELPADALFQMEPKNKFKANKIILGPRVSVEDFLLMKPERVKAALTHDGMLLRYVKEQTHDLCLLAIKQNSDSIQYVKEQTIDLCLIAIEQNANTIQYVKDQLFDLCLRAVTFHGSSLYNVVNQTPELC